MNPSAYGQPLTGRDSEFMEFLTLRRDAEHMTGVKLRLLRTRQRAGCLVPMDGGK